MTEGRCTESSGSVAPRQEVTIELQRTTTPNLNITVPAAVLTYTYNGVIPIEVIARIDIGDVTRPIAGNGDYTVNFYVNGVLVTPVTVVPVPAGVAQTTVVGRPVPIYPGDVVSLSIIGLPADALVDVVATLRTATPLQASDIYGSGPVPVDHNYGAVVDALAYRTSGGAGIQFAEIRAYLQSDYTAGNTGPQYIKARTYTDSNGRFLNPLLLGHATTYVLMYFLPGLYGPDLQTVNVT